MEYLRGIKRIICASETKISEFGVQVWLKVQSLYITCLFLKKKKKKKKKMKQF